MITNETVFILGAGASWHYGYPTGEDLVRKILGKARVAHGYFKKIAEGAESTAILTRPNFVMRNPSPNPLVGGHRAERAEWHAAASECNEFIQRLQSIDPLVIDYFLGHEPALQDLGKMLISWVLLECEALYAHPNNPGNHNRRELLMRSPDCTERERATGLDLSVYLDNWYRFLIHKLAVGCPDSASLLATKVTFITFNYDVSLEYRLFRGLSAIAQFENDNVVAEFFKGNRFIHVYGKIREDPTSEPPNIDLDLADGKPSSLERQNPIAYWNAKKDFLNTIYEASNPIRTIAPLEKIETKDVEHAKQAISEAKCVYILGYGFDERNSGLFDLANNLQVGKGNRKVVLFTNFRDSNRVNKQASRVLCGNPHEFLATKSAIIESSDQKGMWHFEKSTRDVYGALALDFDSPEQ